MSSMSFAALGGVGVSPHERNSLWRECGVLLLAEGVRSGMEKRGGSQLRSELRGNGWYKSYCVFGRSSTNEHLEISRSIFNSGAGLCGWWCADLRLRDFNGICAPLYGD